MDEKKEKKLKKKPGRPRKKPLRPPVVRTGISSTPKKDDNCVEFIYDKPVIFKKVFLLFKAMSAKELTITFDIEEIRITTIDHLKKSDILAVFDCSKMTHYYCEEKSVAVMNAQNVEKVNQVLDKNHTMVTIVSKKQSIRSSLIFIFQNEMKIDEVREVKLIAPTMNNTININDFDGSNHSIFFEMPSKFFKKFMADSSTFSDTLTLQKIGESGPLTFSYISDDKMIKSQLIVKDETIIKLKSKVTDDEIFSASIKIDYVKPLASSLLAESIRVYADDSHKMIFVSHLDNDSIIVKVASNIVQLSM